MEDFTKTDFVVLMQILNKAEKNIHFSDYSKMHIPRLAKKVDARLMEMINKEELTKSQ